MKGQLLSLLFGALLVAATALPQTASAQALCLVDGFGKSWDVTLNNGPDYWTGTMADTAPFDWYATGGRAQGSHRYVLFQATNPNLSNDPGCDDGTGFVDWFLYNGRVTSGGPNYAANGDWVNSCGSSGTWTGTITFGACPAPRQTEPVPGGPAMAPTASSQAEAQAAPEGYAVTSSPNPFERGTVISYTIPEASDVRLTVYDALGREVAVLVDAAREAGTHTVVFDGAGLAAGTYLYHLVAGDYTEARQMTLTR